MREKPLQWSVFAGAGAQFNILPQLSIFAEPLVNCYFDNHSPVVNIYKDRPFNFDIRIGVRVNVK